MQAWGVYFNSPVSFADGLHIQEQLVRARQAEAIPDVVLFLEHKPVVTLGTRGRTNALIVAPDKLAALGIDFTRASRGGDVTYHAPGQLVIYPILKLGENEADAHGYAQNLEEIAIRTAADYGVKAFRRKGKNGAWTDSGKIAAIGFRLRKWVTMHGMSFNIDLDLAGFATIIPCGLAGEKVSSLKAILGTACPAVQDVRSRMARHFQTVFNRKMDIFTEPGKLPLPLRTCF